MSGSPETARVRVAGGSGVGDAVGGTGVEDGDGEGELVDKT